MKEALLQRKLSGGRVRCDTCARHCVLEEGEMGFCLARQNRGGSLFSLVYGQAIALHDDPIEKKPLFHFLPGSRALSLATMGCNMRCLHCQNGDISQIPPGKKINGSKISPQQVIETALGSGCRVMAYTYTEPVVFFDYAYDCAVLAAEKNIKNVFVTNGYWSRQGVEKMLPFLDGANVDLKFFRNETYKQVCQAELKPVLRTIETMHKAGVWLEITTLVIPGLNDGDTELTDIASFIIGLDADIPWHVTRFHPTYRMTDKPVTPVETLQRARDIGRGKGLHHVYTGNIPGEEGENTYCHKCGELLIERYGYMISQQNMKEGACPSCGTAVAGVWR